MATTKQFVTQAIITMDSPDVVAAFNLPATAALQSVIYDQTTGKLVLVFSQPQ